MSGLALDHIATRAKAGVAKWLETTDAPVVPLTFADGPIKGVVAHLSRGDAHAFDHRIVEAQWASTRRVEAAVTELSATLPEAARASRTHVLSEVASLDCPSMSQAVREATNAERCLSLGCRAVVTRGEGGAPKVEFAKDWGALPENPEEVQEAILRFDEEREVWLRRIAQTFK
jgi:hypothetical protein